MHLSVLLAVVVICMKRSFQLLIVTWADGFGEVEKLASIVQTQSLFKAVQAQWWVVEAAFITILAISIGQPSITARWMSVVTFIIISAHPPLIHRADSYCWIFVPGSTPRNFRVFFWIRGSGLVGLVIYLVRWTTGDVSCECFLRTYYVLFTFLGFCGGFGVSCGIFDKVAFAFCADEME